MTAPFKPLPTPEAFWDDAEREPPVTAEAFAAFEARYGYPVPPPFKALYSISDGGWTDYTSILVDGTLVCPFISNRLPPLADWESFSGYAKAFESDDEATLAFAKYQQNSHIIFRHGFEYFVLFWHTGTEYRYAILDLAVPFGEAVGLTMIPIEDDPTRSFVNPLDS